MFARGQSADANEGVTAFLEKRPAALPRPRQRRAARALPRSRGAGLRLSRLVALAPGPCAERRRERVPPIAHDRLPVRDEHPLDVQLQQRLERRIEALAVEALDLGVHAARRPTPAARRRPRPRRRRTRARGGSGRTAAPRVDAACRSDGPTHRPAARRRARWHGSRIRRAAASRMPGGPRSSSRACPFQRSRIGLAAAHVVGDGDQDRDAVRRASLRCSSSTSWRSGSCSGGSSGSIRSVSRSVFSAKRRDLAAEFAWVPLRVARSPAPEVVGEPAWSHRPRPPNRARRRGRLPPAGERGTGSNVPGKTWASCSWRDTITDQER